MDRKTIIVLVASFALMLLWPKLINRIFPPTPLPPRTNDITRATNSRSGAPGEIRAPQTNAEAPAIVPSPAAVPRATMLVAANVTEQTEVIENADARYTFTSLGGGLKLVELKRYSETVGSASRKLDAHAVVGLNSRGSVPVLALLGGETLQGDGVYQLRKMTGGVRAEKVLSNGLAVVKEFVLGSNYLLNVNTRLENRGSQPLALPAQEWEVGTATPMNPLDPGTLLSVFWYNGKKNDIGASEFSSSGFMCMPRTPPSHIARGNNDILWAAAHNQFFALAVIPATNHPAAQVVVLKTNLPAPTAAELKAVPKAEPHPFGLQAAIFYPPTTLAAGAKLERQFHIYAGPKEYRLLAELGATFKNNLDLIMGYGGFFGFFAKVLLLSMNGLHDLLHLSYGLVIIVITVIIKLLFWPLTQASTRSMKRMQKLQPQMKALQEKYKDDPAKMNRKLMEFMKENKVSPMAGCLPMLIQLPVFFGFYQMIQSAIELRGARFLWATDLSQPDTIFEIPGLGWPVNPLPLLMGATMLWQARLTPPSPGMDPVQQKIMKYMPVMFLFILYNFSAGLTLYWTVQNLLTIAQMKLTRSKEDTSAAPKPAAPKAALPAAKKKK